jgi:mannitol 2-dehydrogenase
MASEEIKIISLTITEGGYNFDQITGEFIKENPDVKNDINSKNPPKTVFGYIYRALKLRYEKGIKPFTVMSCDNIQGNGDVCKKAIISFAELVGDKKITDWIKKEVPFPSSMVDRITPKTTPNDIKEIEEKYGIKDNWPVVSEDFMQWVLEDNFVFGRPLYEQVGVQIVNDVEPYELMKLRLLNASHQGIAYFGYLMGYEFVDEAASDPLMQKFLMRYMNDEATPTLKKVEGVDLGLYKKTLIERFTNKAIKDTIARLAADSSDRIPKWIVPVINERLKQGGKVALSAAIVASWARYAEGIDEKEQPIEIIDNAKTSVMKAAAEQKNDPLSFIRQKVFFGNLIEEERFTKDYLEALESLHKNGARNTLKMLVES